MRNIKPTPNEHYHLYNRGGDHRIIFIDDSDRIRFLFLILYFQSEKTIGNISHHTDHYKKLGAFDFYGKMISSLSNNRNVELTGFCLMTNHFHLSVYEKEENGISRYMQRVGNAYTKYFNVKYRKSGHLLSGPYRIVHVKDNVQLLHLSSYIHLNPREIREWRGKEESYPWSSFQDFVKENRWGEFLKRNIILEQFDTKESYKNFVASSTAKKMIDMLPQEHLELDEN